MARLGFHERQAARALALCGVYLLRPKDLAPAEMPMVKPVATVDIAKRLADWQIGNWRTLDAGEAFWFAGAPIAKTIVSLTEGELAKCEWAAPANNGWWMAAPGRVWSVVNDCAKKLGATWVTEARRRELLGAETDRRIAKARDRLYSPR